MTDRFPISSSAFSDLPPQPSCQSCRLALHRASGGLSAAALAHDSLESLGEFLSRFFDPLGETVRGPIYGGIMGLKRRTKRHHNNTPICFAHLDKCSGSHASWPSLFHMSGFSTNHLGLGLGLE